MSDTIRAALEKAAQAMCREAKSCRGDCGDRCAWREPDVSMPACAAAAIAAFHEHMAAEAKRIGTARALEEAFRHESIAAAVEAAKEAMADTTLQGRELVPLPIAPQPGIAASRHDPDAQHEPHGPCGDRACAHGCWTWRSFGRRCGAAKEVRDA